MFKNPYTRKIDKKERAKHDGVKRAIRQNKSTGNSLPKNKTMADAEKCGPDGNYIERCDADSCNQILRSDIERWEIKKDTKFCYNCANLLIDEVSDPKEVTSDRMKDLLEKFME